MSFSSDSGQFRFLSSGTIKTPRLAGVSACSMTSTAVSVHFAQLFKAGPGLLNTKLPSLGLNQRKLTIVVEVSYEGVKYNLSITI